MLIGVMLNSTTCLLRDQFAWNICTITSVTYVMSYIFTKDVQVTSKIFLLKNTGMLNSDTNTRGERKDRGRGKE